jgi:hypothetical protein
MISGFEKLFGTFSCFGTRHCVFATADAVLAVVASAVAAFAIEQP